MVYMHRSLFNVMYLIAFCNSPLLHHCYITHSVTNIAERQQAIEWYLLIRVQIANRLKVLDGYLQLPR